MHIVQALIIPTLGPVVDKGGGKSLVAAVKAVPADGVTAKILSEVQNARGTECMQDQLSSSGQAFHCLTGCRWFLVRILWIQQDT